VLFYFTLLFTEFTTFEKSLVIMLILLTLINCGAMLEQQRWVFYLEIIRATVTSIYLSYEVESPWLLLMLVMVIAMAAVSETAERWYYRMVYQYH
jgi:hypothetical protein